MKAELVYENGVHAVKINGKIYSFAATRSFRPEGRILKQFSDHGIKFFNIFPSGIMTALGNRTIPYSLFGPVWTGIGEYNWDNLRAQCDEFFKNISDDTFVSISVHLDPPQWYVDSHKGFVDHWEQMMQNIGSDEWKKDATDYMYALIDKMDEWYPDRVYAVFLLCGGTTEWYSYHEDEIFEKVTDIHSGAYRKYMRDASVAVPSLEVLNHSSDGVLRDPVRDKAAIDYWRFLNEIVPDTIMYFAHKAKEHTHGTKLVGLFNSQSYGANLDRVVRLAYMNLVKFADCPDIDMIFCPASYMMRKLESTSGIRTPVDSMCACHKLFVHEIDSSTHLLKKKANTVDNGAFLHASKRDETFTCSSDTKMYIRREVGLSLAKGQGYWWFDMFSGYYDDPELMDEISRLHDLQDVLLEKGCKPVSEVCEILDRESAFMLTTECHYPMLEHQTPILNSARAPWDMLETFSLFDKNYDIGKKKLFIFPALFSPEKRTKDKIRELAAAGKSFLFMHAPGYVTESGFSLDAMKELTGITFKKVDLSDNTILGTGDLDGVSYDFTNRTVIGDCWPNKGNVDFIKPVFTPTDLDEVWGVFKENGLPALGIKYTGNGGIVAFSACAPVPVEVIANVYEKAGVFIYTDRFDPVYTSSTFECAYSFAGGKRKMYRPEPSVLTDFFTKEKFTVGPEGTEIDFMPHETKMFTVEKLN